MVLRSFWRQNQLHSTHSFQENTILVNQFGWYKIIMANFQCVLSHYCTSFHETIYKGTNTCGPSFWQPRKGHEKCIFEALHNDIKCVLSIKESKRIKKNDRNFHICLRSGPRGLTPSHPLLVSLTVKYQFFYDSPKINIVARDRNFYFRKRYWVEILKSATVYLSLAAVFNIFEIGSLL